MSYSHRNTNVNYLKTYQTLSSASKNNAKIANTPNYYMTQTSFKSSNKSTYHATNSNYKSKIGTHKNLFIVGKTDDDQKIGGYTISDLVGEGYVKDKYAFLYNFKKEKKFKILKEDEALYLKEGNFPCFGDGDVTFGPGTQKIKFPKSYKGDDLELTGGKSEIKFDDIEIFYLSTSDK